MKLLSGMKRKYSLHCPQFSDIGNSQEFSMHGGPVCGQGTDACRWIVDTPMLKQRKTYGCSKYPFYKNFPHPPRTSYLLPPTYLLMSSRIPRFFLISQTCFSHLIRIVESVSRESRSFPDSRDCPSSRRRIKPFLCSICQNSTFLSLSSPMR